MNDSLVIEFRDFVLCEHIFYLKSAVERVFLHDELLLLVLLLLLLVLRIIKLLNLNLGQIKDVEPKLVMVLTLSLFSLLRISY